MDEAGSQSHDELARKLEQKIREGERARYVSTLTFQYIWYNVDALFSASCSHN